MIHFSVVISLFNKSKSITNTLQGALYQSYQDFETVVVDDGSTDGSAEPDVLNPDAIILWNRKDRGASALRQIRELHDSPSLLKEFISQPRLVSTAEEFVLATFSSIISKLNKLIECQ